MIDNIINTWIKLIKIPSFHDWNDGLYEVVRFVKYFFNNEDIYIDEFESNNKPSIIIKNFKWKESDIILNWHLDVVPLSDPKQIEPYIEWNILYWRWAIDMKMSVSILLHVFKEVYKKTNKKIILILTTDEEIWWNDWTRYLLEKWYSWKIAFIPDSWSLNNIVIAEKWVLNIEFEAKWVSCHSARPWLWKNPVDSVMNMYFALKDDIEDKEKLNSSSHWWNSVNLNVISWWNATNQIPEKISWKIDIRYTDSISQNDIVSSVKNIFKKYDIEIKNMLIAPCVFVDWENEFVLKYKKIAEKKLWSEITLVKEHWASDARFFQEKWIPVIFHRPNWGNLHSKDEYIEIDSIITIFNSLKEFILSI